MIVLINYIVYKYTKNVIGFYKDENTNLLPYHDIEILSQGYSTTDCFEKSLLDMMKDGYRIPLNIKNKIREYVKENQNKVFIPREAFEQAWEDWHCWNNPTIPSNTSWTSEREQDNDLAKWFKCNKPYHSQD